MAGKNGRIDVRVHHHVGAVADHDDGRAGGIGHGRAPAGGDLVAHAGEAELAVEGVRRLDAPVLHHLARQAAGGGDEEIALLRPGIDDADDLGIGRHRRVGRLLVAVERRVPLGEFLPALFRPAGIRPVVADGGFKLAHRLQRIADDGDGAVLVRIPARRIDRDEAGIRRKRRPRAGGEVHEARADGQHHIGLAG